MLSAVGRLLVVTISALAIAAVPIYPGATLDVAEMKAVRARNPEDTFKVYHSNDSYEQVMAFYRSRGGRELWAMSTGNTAKQKMGSFMFGDSTVAINWPGDVRDQAGVVPTRSGTRIAIGME